MKPIRYLFLIPALLFCASSFAYDFGYVSVRGFVLGQLTYATNICKDCQRHPDEDRQRSWADEILPDKDYEPAASSLTLFHPYLALNPISLGGGYKFSALLSQRWRNGNEDIPGTVYDKNISLTHEYHGAVTYGAFPTRGWSVADFPYGAKVGLADGWGSSGSGYGLVSNAIRISGPLLDVFNGELRLEFTYDPGGADFKGYDKRFYEFYVQYVKGRLVIDFIYQDTKNGKPGSWTHGPFLGLTDDSKYEEALDGSDLPENKQTIHLLMSRYQIRTGWEVLGGIRRNYWSGADAVIVGYADDGDALWNNMFNVDWDGTLNGVPNPGYPAASYDWMIGSAYQYTAEISFSAGFLNLGTATTDNPEERGQSNSMNLMGVGMGYGGLYPNLNLAVFMSRVSYAKKGLAPLSMPSHSSFSGVDSRVVTSGMGFGTEISYNF